MYNYIFKKGRRRGGHAGARAPRRGSGDELLWTGVGNWKVYQLWRNEDPETWTHGPSIIKENELREVAVLLGKGFRVHHPDAVGGVSLSYNPNPKKYMVMQYHSVENGFRLPLHGLLRDLCLHFGFAPGQLTANAHKYVASYILRCCALDRTPKLDEFLLLFSIGGFPFYSLYPHNHFPIFEKVEFKHEKWSLRYFVIEFPAHSPLDLPGVVLRRSISRTKFATAELAEGVYNALREKEGNSTALAIRKPTAALEAIPISAIPGLRRPIPSQKRPREGVTDDDFLPKKNKGDDTSVSPSPLSASFDTQHTIPAATSGGLELPHPDIFDCKGEELRDQSALKRPITQPQPEAAGSSPHTTTIPQVMEEEGVRRQEPESSPTAEKEVEVQTETEIPSSKKNEVGEQRDTEALPEMERETERQPEPEGQCSTATLPAPNIPMQRKFTPRTYPAFTEGWAGFSRGLRSLQASHWTIQGNLEKMRESVQEPTIPQARPDLLALNTLHFMEQAQQSLLTLTEEYLGGASGNYRAVVLLKEKALAAKALQQKVDSLEQQVRVLQEENARLKADGLMELTAERSKVKSLQEQIATYQRGTQDLEAQFDRLRAQISILESRASASEYKVGNLEAGLMEARRLTLEKLKEERQTASELRLKMDELEKTTAAHQEEVATLTARAEALYEEGKFDMQQCIYEEVQSGLPENRSLDDFISYYGLPLPLSPPSSRADPGL
ncbi:unnamed protein product [Cuscuta campestris]|uniref:Uncharacterized protein n=1 Tax=Cuscuta campestris TaxID=132261 RepID=A0A484KLK6_9ASTE|nr:unnamed protein product [Cuscuta campestris]